jgi:hypothetical protein
MIKNTTLLHDVRDKFAHKNMKNRHKIGLNKIVKPPLSSQIGRGRWKIRQLYLGLHFCITPFLLTITSF